MLRSKGLGWLLGMAAMVVILAGLKAAESIVIPLMLALFIAIISTPFLRMLTNRGVQPDLAVLLVLSVLVVFGGILVLIVSQSIDSFMQNLPFYQTRLKEMLADLVPILQSLNIPITKDELLGYINTASLVGTFGKALAAVGALLTNVFLIIFILIFLLLEEASFPRKLQAAFPDSNGFAMDAAQDFFEKVNKYLLIKTVISALTGVAVTILLWAIGVDYPVLWGLIAMLMNFIPNIGSLLAAIPPILLSLIQLGFADMVWVALGFLVINMIIGNVLEPRYMGQGLGLSPLVVFLSLVIWGWLFGPVGMFLSIPLTMIAKIWLEQFEGTRPIAILLGR